MGRLRPAAALTAVLLAFSAAPASAQLRAGAASADITAPVGTPMFAYTARSKLANPSHLGEAPELFADPDPNLYAKTFVASRGIHTRILSRALVLQQGTTKLALVQADLGGLPYALTQSVLERIRPTGIDGDHLLLSATHTHSSTGPIWPLDNLGYAGLGGDLFDPRVFEITAQGIADAILHADRALQPARAGVATVEVTNASRNREPDPFKRNKDLAASPDPINPDLTVLRVDDRRGRPIGLWSNFAIHPTSFGDGNLDFSGDNAGVAARLAEAAIGHRAVDVWTNSAEGDTSPNGDASKLGGEAEQYVATDAAKADLAGERVAAGIVSAWRAAGRRMSADVGLGARRSFLSFDGTQADGAPVGPVPVLGMGVESEGTCAPVNDLAGPGQGAKMPLAGGPLLPTTFPVSLARVGGLAIAAFPTEITKQMGTRIVRSVAAKAGADRVVIAGLTNAYASYTATPEEYDACTYEGSFTLFGRQQGARYRDFATALAAGTTPPGAGSEPPATGFGADNAPSPRTTPGAGTAVAQPGEALQRYNRAVFRWKGGDPSIDAPRGTPFVTLQRRTASGGWKAVATDDTFADTTERAGDDTWTETFQLDECAPIGTYRFAVIGRADSGDGPAPYALQSRTFLVRALTLAAGTPAIAGSTVSVPVRYPDPGASPLALPRLVRTGTARLRVERSDGSVRLVTARPDPSTGAFTAAVAGARSATLIDARDACGNATA
jgi:neutral ceramidase